jgi:3-hydroxyacyl-[acyl-carrier-protein] dehydratase
VSAVTVTDDKTTSTIATALRVPIEADQIRQLLPHRWPFLFLDRVTELEPGVRGVGLKNVSVAEPYFEGHTTGVSIMPGALIIESCAQLCGIVILSGGAGQSPAGSNFALVAGVKNFRFRRIVRPGDQLKMTAEMGAMLGPACELTVKATVDGETAAGGRISFAAYGL